MDQTQDVVVDIVRAQQEQALKAKNEAIINFYGQLWEKASAYTKIITAAGYGGFFAAWSGAKAYLSPKQNLAAALSLTFSLFVFVGWEVFHMILSAHQLNAANSKLVDASLTEFEDITVEIREQAARMNYRLRKVWFAVLVLAIIPGFGGAAVLIYAFVHKLVA